MSISIPSKLLLASEHTFLAIVLPRQLVTNLLRFQLVPSTIVRPTSFIWQLSDQTASISGHHSPNAFLLHGVVLGPEGIHDLCIPRIVSLSLERNLIDLQHHSDWQCDQRKEPQIWQNVLSLPSIHFSSFTYQPVPPHQSVPHE